MKLKLHAAALAAAAALCAPAQAQTEIQWWHSMGGALGEWVNDQANEFNASQKDYKIVPTFKGSYDESMTGWPDDCHHDADDEGDGEWPEG